MIGIRLIGIRLIEDSLDRDYQDQLQRIAPLETNSAIESFELKAGLKIELIACEPMVVDPVAITFDQWGRAYVVEMRGYSERGDQMLGRIKRLEDTDQDGRFDKSTVFAERFRWPTAIVCFAGGVLVGDAPEIVFLKDDDNDGHADYRQVVFSGLGTSNVQQLPNSFQWGIDNHIYGASGGNGGRLSRVEFPDNSPLAKLLQSPNHAVDVRGRDFKINPTTLELQPIAGGTQFGMTVDRWGTRYVCSNSDHCQQIIFEDRYAARNQQQKIDRSRISIAVEGPAAEVFRSSPVEPWRKVRTRLRVQGLVRGPVEGGGRAAGYFTSATGICCYDGDLLPREFAGNLFVGDVGSNLVHRKKIIGDEVQKQAVRTELGTEFLRSTDNWFRPVQLANAPDGSLIVLDMYRETIEHPASLPPLIKKHLDLNSGNQRGRIYRIVPADLELAAKSRQLPGDASLQQLVKMLEHPNGWHRQTAARVLLEKWGSKKNASLKAELIRAIRGDGLTSENPETRIRSLYLLSSLDAVHKAELSASLGDGHPQVRIHALRIAESCLDRDLEKQIIAMTNDPNPLVRFQVALTLGECELETAKAIASLAEMDGSNPWMQTALANSAARNRGKVIQCLVQRAAEKSNSINEDALKNDRDLLMELTDQLVRKPTDEDLGVVGDVVQAWPDDSDPVSRGEFVARLIELPEARMQTLQSLLSGRGISLEQVIESTTRQARQLALDQLLDTQKRVEAIGLLRMDRPDSIAELVTELLGLTQPPEVKRAIIELAGNFETAEIAEIILARFSELSPALRSRTLQVLLTRETWTRQLLTQIESGLIPPVLINATARQRLVRNPDPNLQSRANEVLGGQSDLNRQDLVQRYMNEVDPLAGNVERGRKLFLKSCAACHRLENQGNEIGPNLAAFANRGTAAMITNILDPNREVDPRFLSYQIQLQDGRTLAGVIANETASTIGLRDSEGKTVAILREEIEAQQSTTLSLMPENFENELNPQAMSDLIKYLLSQGS